EEHVDSTPDQARSMGDLRDDDLGAHVARMETEGDDCLTEGPPGATGKVPTPAVIVSDDEATIQIASLLRRVTEEGGGHNFVIFEVGHCHYVQFATSCGSAVLYGEASSGRYCTPNCTCSPTAAQRARLRSLGWRPPTR